MNDLINKVIEIGAIEMKAGKFGKMAKIKDEKNLTYTVYQMKKDGTESVAWQALQNLDIGTNVQIGFSEEVVNHPEHGNYTARTIRAFNTDIGSGAANSSAQKETSRVGSPTASPTPAGDAFGRRLAIHGFVNALINSGTKPSAITGETILELTALEDRIDTILNPSSFRQTVARSAPSVVEELPVIRQEFDGSDVPF